MAREDDFKNTKRCDQCIASVRSEDKETVLQDTANAAELAECNGRRRRGGLPTEDELEVAEFLVTEDFRSRWASASDDVLVAAATMVQMKKGLNYSAPVQKVSCPNCNQTRRGPGS